MARVVATRGILEDEEGKKDGGASGSGAPQEGRSINRKAAKHHDEAVRHYEVGSFVAAAAESGHPLGQQAAVVLHTAQAARAHATHDSTKK